MNAFDIAAILITLAAIFEYINYRLLKLPSTIGIMSIALVSSIIMLLIDAVVPSWHLRETLAGFLVDIDFNEALMHGMLCFLLFAGALHVELDNLLSRKWTIGSLATIGVVLSTAVIGSMTWLLFSVLGMDVPFMVCLVFGAIISPTDPIAVLGLLKELKAPKTLEAKIAGESLFNDGVGVVVFLALVSVAGLSGGGHGGGGVEHAAEAAVHAAEAVSTSSSVDVVGIGILFIQEVVGGLLLGLGFGYVAYRALKSIDYHQLELLITLALVMFMYALSFWLHVSGPIAVVVAGLFIGNHGKRFAMSEGTASHVDAFWSMVDEIMNAVLFLLIGLEVFAIHMTGKGWIAAVAVVPIALLARLIAVSVPIAFLRRIREYPRGIVQILTWGGLRGGISVALVLSLPEFEQKELLLSCTYAVVLFSVLVQGLTMRRVFSYFGVGQGSSGRTAAHHTPDGH
jgi:CPA1 family monovalent cation:H+ antiporter